MLRNFCTAIPFPYWCHFYYGAIQLNTQDNFCMAQYLLALAELGGGLGY